MDFTTTISNLHHDEKIAHLHQYVICLANHAGVVAHFIRSSQ